MYNVRELSVNSGRNANIKKHLDKPCESVMLLVISYVLDALM